MLVSRFYPHSSLTTVRAFCLSLFAVAAGGAAVAKKIQVAAVENRRKRRQSAQEHP